MAVQGSKIETYEVWLTSTTAPLIDEENGLEVDHERYELRADSLQRALEKARERQRRYNNNHENGKAVLVRKLFKEHDHATPRWVEVEAN